MTLVTHSCCLSTSGESCNPKSSQHWTGRITLSVCVVCISLHPYRRTLESCCYKTNVDLLNGNWISVWTQRTQTVLFGTTQLVARMQCEYVKMLVSMDKSACMNGCDPEPVHLPVPIYVIPNWSLNTQKLELRSKFMLCNQKRKWPIRERETAREGKQA